MTGLLTEIRDGLSRPPFEVPKASIAKDALRKFVMKLAGSAGEGLGKTITWGARMALVMFAMNILRDLGFTVDDLVRIAEKVLPR